MVTTEQPTIAPSRTATVVARICKTIVTALFLFICVSKLLQLQFMVESTSEMGFPPQVVPVIGGTLAICLVLYLVPRTQIIGAVALTAFMGGAVCAHLRMMNPIFPHLTVPVLVGLGLWVPLYVHNELVRRIVHVGR